MGTEVVINKKPMLVKIAEQLMKDQLELDSWAVQIALGKAELKDKYEEAKKQMKKSIRDFRETLHSELKKNNSWNNTFKSKLNKLEDQLSIGMAETKKLFAEQRKIIATHIEDLKIELKKNPMVFKMADFFMAALEKLKFQLELIERKMEEEKKELTNEFKVEMNKAGNKIKSILSDLNERKAGINSKIENFSNEINAAYAHIKKAVKVF